MSDSPEGFARRWSRLKRHGETPPAVAVPEAPMEVPPPAETIPLEEIAGWMARRVPDSWRQAALRRLWVSDPAISSFVGLADYAWDFTVEGGAPGWGAMRAIDDVAKLLARAIGEVPADPALEPKSESPPAAAEAVPGVEAQPDVVSPAIASVAAPEPETRPMRRRGGGAVPV